MKRRSDPQLKMAIRHLLETMLPNLLWTSLKEPYQFILLSSPTRCEIRETEPISVPSPTFHICEIPQKNNINAKSRNRTNHRSHIGGPQYPPPPPIVSHQSENNPHHHQHHPPLPSFSHQHSHHSSEVANKPSVRVYSKAETNYSLTIRDGKVILAPSNPSDPFQHWVKDDKYSTRVKDEQGFPSFALIKKATGQAMKHSIGATHPVLRDQRVRSTFLRQIQFHDGQLQKCTKKKPLSGMWSLSGMNERGHSKYSMSVSMYREGARGYGRTRTAPPDLPSLLLDTRIVYLGMQIVPAVTELLVAQFMWLDRESPSKPIYLCINSSGTQIGLDGIRMLDPATSRFLRIYPLDTITRCEAFDSSTFAFCCNSTGLYSLHFVTMETTLEERVKKII
ncbi:unnamed protein product [Fraxinus pennsylvanica]|uniref:ATP-dependent Clp protease proteolytic subunit n=1 Tax=Fraxinus pennsylvanica TaxID=56036 RepID=A0AAD2DZJ6_9LAMI|nr:unnamed protein product [Fraxinus pennsylvanica]